MVTVHDILAGAILAGIAGVAVFQELSTGDDGQGLLIRVLGGESPERDAAPPPPPGARPSITGTIARSVTPTRTGGGGGGGGGSGSGGGTVLGPAPGPGHSRIDPQVFERELTDTSTTRVPRGGPTPV